MKRGGRLIGAAARARLIAALGALGALAVPVGAGCGGGDSLVLIGGERVDSALIDRDPIALLPGGIVMLGYLDAAQMFSTGVGAEVDQIVKGLLPIGPESNFVPSRDVARVYGGLYAMQGADFCAILQGNFDPDAIRRSADMRAVTVAGAPLVKSRYAGNDLYTAGNIGFVVLTPHTLLTGNETGMRRALDRLRGGKLERSIPAWMIDLAGTRGASFALAGDLATQAAVASASQQIPFLAGLQYVRVTGNFQPPGLNLAGAFTYTDPQAAANGAVALRNLEGIARVANFLTTWGFGSVPPMQVAQSQNDVAFTLPMSDGTVRSLLRMGADTIQRLAAAR
ncbi:MAG: hypothetical protein IT372_23160 [Polyangiaceae bacterium]|nr:hypothetical protein [Polyangiaceae bacterium]